MTELVPVERAVADARVTLDNLSALVAKLATYEQVNEARARIEALRAWAKVHKKLREVRLDLLRAEVAALVRIVELGGVEKLPVGDRKPAEYLASLPVAERDRLVASSAQSATTATGMVKALWTSQELKIQREMAHRRGQTIAANPPKPLSEDAIRAAQYRVTDVAAVLRQTVTDYTSKGVAFAVSDMADEIIQSAGITGEFSDDDVLRAGVREVCREAIRRAPVVQIEGTILPRLITARLDDGNFIRIPIENATLAHLDDTRALRREQIALDQAALARLDEVAQRLRALPGAADDSQIGDLIAASIEQAGAA